MHKIEHPAPHPTDFAAFRRMIADMTIPELRSMSDLIEKDIVKYMEQPSNRHDIQEWVEKVKLLAEQEKVVKQLKLNFKAA